MTSYHEAMRRAMDVENRPGAECAHWLAVATELRNLMTQQGARRMTMAQAHRDPWAEQPVEPVAEDITPPARRWQCTMFGYDLDSPAPPRESMAGAARGWLESVARSNRPVEVLAVEAAREMVRRWDESQAEAARAAFGEAVARNIDPMVLGDEPPRDGDLWRTELGQLQEYGGDRWYDVDEPPAHGEVHLSLGDRDPVNLGEATQTIRVPDMAVQTDAPWRVAVRTCAWCTLAITHRPDVNGGSGEWRHVRTNVAACADGVTLAWPGEPSTVE